MDEKEQSAHQATVFNADGSISHHRQGRPPETPMKVPAPAPAVRKAATGGEIPCTPEMNPALMQRLADQAARSVDEQADDLADAIYTKFMSLLTDKITENGGTLTMDDVAEMGDVFRTQIGDIKETFLSAVETYVQARDKNRVSSERGNIFNRIMVHHFEDRFTNEETLIEKPDLLSRRMLPGYYSVLSMMFGPPKLARYEQQAKAVVGLLRKGSSGELEWDDVHQSTEAKRLTLRAEIDIARHFKDTEKRLDWMVAMINSNMIPLEDGRLSSGWNFTREAAEGLLAALFSNLRAAMKDEATRQKFADELGGDTVMVLDAVTKRFVK